ncbi:MAG TPA: transcriptional repressor LexA [bacterium]|nr:transcriptional repressor LexA [bacterium]
MSPKEMTDRQRAILEYIYDYQRDYGYPPTIRQIGKHFGIKSPNGVADHLKALERKGEIGLSRNTARGIDLINREELGIPLVGRIAAGEPILAAENIEDHITIEKMFPSDGRIFALRVKGESMIEDGIHDGDIVVVRPQSTAENGDTVVALLEDEATVKRFYRERKRIRLQPANSSYAPIYSKSVEIRGKVIGVIRTL